MPLRTPGLEWWAGENQNRQLEETAMNRKTVSRALLAPLASLAITAMAFPAMAQDFPTRTVRIITPAAPGGTTDILARIVAQKLTEMYKTQQVIVENRSSATGVVGTDYVAKSDPDGYTLLLAYHQNTVNGALGVPMPYHPVNSFTPITQLTAAPLLLVINPNSPPQNLQEFIDWSKKKGDVSFGSAGVGSGGHLAGELYKLLAKVKGEHIPYKGTGPALVDLMGGRYDYNFSGLQSALVQARAGKLRALAVTSPKRLNALPDIPAVAEAIPGFDVVGWYGIIGPAKIPAPVVQRLYNDLTAVLKAPDVNKRILADGSEPVGSTPEAFREFMTNDLNKWIKVVKDGNIKVQGL
jgi:tripartite-type tricarboxylate transporter receptor subunit TctC